MSTFDKFQKFIGQSECHSEKNLKHSYTDWEKNLVMKFKKCTTKECIEGAASANYIED